MKKILLILLTVFLSTQSFAQLGQTIGTGAGAVVGAGLLGGISSSIMSGQTDKKVANQKDKIGCYVNGKKMSGWEGNLILPAVNVEAQRSTLLYQSR